MSLDDSYKKKEKEYLDDTVMNCIIKNYISLKDTDVKINNQHLQKIILNGLVPLMKEDALFKDAYRDINYAGSFFKGTKVGTPDEYDLDLKIRLPLNYRTLKIDTNHNNYGYVKVKVDDLSKLPKWETHNKILNKLLDDEGYLDQNKFRQWMEKVMTKTFDRLKKVDKDYELVVENKTYTLKQYKKSGPAFTIFVQPNEKSEDNHIMDVDLVPCLEFDDIVLNGYKLIPNMTRKLIIVARPSDELDGNRLWRLSFYDQEKQLLQENEAGKLKPIIRLIKKLRDKLEWKQLKSYYIETLFLNELYKRKTENDVAFFRAPKTCLFIYINVKENTIWLIFITTIFSSMLRKLSEAINERKLPYFWHSKHNLLDNMKEIVSENYRRRLESMLNHVEKNIFSNRFIIAEQLLSTTEVKTLKGIVCPGTDIEDPELTECMKDLIIHDSIKPNLPVMQNEDVVDSPRKTTNNINHSIESTTVKSRVEMLCKELNTFSKLKNQLSEEDKEELKKSCMALFITLYLENQKI